MIARTQARNTKRAARTLSPKMTLREFENGYWYADQLKAFAVRIGIPAATKLRKDELEQAIVAWLRSGTAALSVTRARRRTGLKDVKRGLKLTRRIQNYTSDRETKDFIIEQAYRLAPDVRTEVGSVVSPESLARSASRERRADQPTVTLFGSLSH